MERDDQYYNSRDYEGDNRRQRHSNAGDKLSNYQTRYENHGNYYGMPDSGHEYKDVRAEHGPLYGNNTSGPVGGYGASSYRGAYDQGSQGDYGRWNEQSRSHRNEGDRDKRNYNYGSGSDRQGSSEHRNRDNHYRYGDPNPYMGGYEQTRGTGWQSDSSGAYRGSYSTNDNSRYARQDNSYQSGGQGRRYSDYGRDEQRSYNPGNVDAYYDRSDFNHSSSDNNYQGRQRQDRFYDSDARRHEELQQGEIRNVRDSRSHINDQDYTKHENRYRSGSEERRHRSGPNYNASSSASSYTESGSIR